PSATPTIASKPVVLIAGGTGMVKLATGESPAVLASAEIYEPDPGVFLPINSMTSNRTRHGAVSLANGHVLIIGGVDAEFVPVISGPSVPGILSSTHYFDPDYGRFTIGPSMIKARDSPSAIALADGRILIVGGSETDAELYDPKAGKFNATGQMDAQRYGQTATLLKNGKVL